MPLGCHAEIESFSRADRERFLSTCPDFVIELVSPSDQAAQPAAKMHDWINNGCQLGWLIDPAARTVAVYRREGIEILESPTHVAGEHPVDGFVLDLTYIWEPGW